MQRPTSVTVLAILNFVFAGLGLCGVLFLLVSRFLPQDPNIPNPVLEVMEKNAAYAMFTRISMGLSFVAIPVLVASGIGLLQLKPWGRHCAIGWAVYSIAMGIIGAVMNYVFVFGPLMEKLDEIDPGPEKVGAISGIVGGSVGLCFGMIYPIVLLIFMFRPNVVQAFQPSGTVDEMFEL